MTDPLTMCYDATVSLNVSIRDLITICYSKKHSKLYNPYQQVNYLLSEAVKVRRNRITLVIFLFTVH